MVCSLLVLASLLRAVLALLLLVPLYNFYLTASISAYVSAFDAAACLAELELELELEPWNLELKLRLLCTLHAQAARMQHRYHRS